jgi:hypothetical protein
VTFEEIAPGIERLAGAIMEEMAPTAAVSART